MVLSERKDLLHTFLWIGKGNKINRTVMINNFGVCGLKMFDIKLLE